jgi:endonuclease VIII
MPEGDTIHRTAARLRAALLGRALTRVELPRAVGRLPRAGQVVSAIEARGKHLLIHVDDLVVHTHLGMTGSWRLYRPGQRWTTSPRAARVVLGVDDAEAVCAASPVTEVLDAAGLARHPVLRRLGPDLCDPAADLGEATARLRRLSAPDRPVGEALLDQRVACGIGNVYRCDVLFLHGIHPGQPVASLTDDEVRSVLETSARLLRTNLQTPRRTTVPGAPSGTLWVHGRRGRPCRRCATPVVCEPLGDPPRHAYWCPGCQSRR